MRTKYSLFLSNNSLLRECLQATEIVLSKRELMGQIETIHHIELRLHLLLVTDYTLYYSYVADQNEELFLKLSWRRGFIFFKSDAVLFASK